MDSQRLVSHMSWVRESSCLPKPISLLLEYECIRSPLLLRLPNRRSVEVLGGSFRESSLKQW